MLVQVKTAVGVSGTAFTSENLNREAGLPEYCVKLVPLLLQDDSFRLTTSVEGAREGCERFESVIDSKALEANITKSIYLPAGKKKNFEMIRAGIAKEPLCYKELIVKEKRKEK